jgi:hypothetical protein
MVGSYSSQVRLAQCDEGRWLCRGKPPQDNGDERTVAVEGGNALCSSYSASAPLASSMEVTATAATAAATLHSLRGELAALQTKDRTAPTVQGKATKVEAQADHTQPGCTLAVEQQQRTDELAALRAELARLHAEELVSLHAQLAAVRKDAARAASATAATSAAAAGEVEVKVVREEGEAAWTESAGGAAQAGLAGTDTTVATLKQLWTARRELRELQLAANAIPPHSLRGGSAEGEGQSAAGGGEGTIGEVVRDEVVMKAMFDELGLDELLRMLAPAIDMESPQSGDRRHDTLEAALTEEREAGIAWGDAASAEQEGEEEQQAGFSAFAAAETTDDRAATAKEMEEDEYWTRTLQQQRLQQLKAELRGAGALHRQPSPGRV